MLLEIPSRSRYSTGCLTHNSTTDQTIWWTIKTGSYCSLSPCVAKYHPHSHRCVPSDTISQSATGSVCPLYCTWFGGLAISNSKSAHLLWLLRVISGTEDMIHKDSIKFWTFTVTLTLKTKPNFYTKHSSLWWCTTELNLVAKRSAKSDTWTGWEMDRRTVIPKSGEDSWLHLTDWTRCKMWRTRQIIIQWPPSLKKQIKMHPPAASLIQNNETEAKSLTISCEGSE